MSCARDARRGSGAQAIIETAIVIPVLLVLISVFLAVMVQVEVQQQMDAATKLAAESFFQAPRDAVDAAGTTCCPQQPGGADSLHTGGLPKGCRFAGETYYGTMSFRRFLVFPAQQGGRPLCLRAGALVGAARGSLITCDVQAVDRALRPPASLAVVRCSSSATLDFSRTPLAWAIPWSPTVTSTAEAIPPPFRQ